MRFTEQAKADAEMVIEKLKEIDPEYKDSHIGLGSLASDVLEHWEALWDWDISYDIIILENYIPETHNPY